VSALRSIFSSEVCSLALFVLRDNASPPLQLNPKYLDNLTLQLPSSSRSGKLGTLSKKGVTYDITSFPSSASLSQDLQTQAAAPFGAEELDSLSCLLPRKKKGAKLFVGMFSFIKFCLTFLTRPTQSAEKDYSKHCHLAISDIGSALTPATNSHNHKRREIRSTTVKSSFCSLRRR
jgi:hypothetical protein